MLRQLARLLREWWTRRDETPTMTAFKEMLR